MHIDNAMKKILLLSLSALLLTGCTLLKHKEAEPETSVAKESVWDLYLIGSWRYAEQGATTEYPKGIETFFADGSYMCCTEDGNGEKILIKGTWKLDDAEDFTVWVKQMSVENAEGTISSDEKTVKYIIESLTPKEELRYQIGDTSRAAEWME